MVEDLNDIYKNVKNCEKKGSVSFTISLKRELERNIGDNKDILMHYKICAETSTEAQLRDLFLTGAVLMISILSAFDDFNKGFTIINFFVVVSYIAVIVLFITVLWDFIKSSKYTVIQGVLEEIDKEWDTKHIQKDTDQGEDHEE